MSTNRFFNKFQRTSEQKLVDKLITEAIQIHGIDLLYLPRTLQKEDSLYGEDILSQFDDYYDIEMYVKNVDGFEGSGDLASKFGVDISDQATLQVSVTRWNDVVANEQIRPKEGDLIYYPFNGAIFQVSHVKNESIFYQLGELYVYELSIEQFVYSDEKLATGIEEIDDIEKTKAYTVKLTLNPGVGTFVKDEWIYQGPSFGAATAKAQISEFDSPIDTIDIRNTIGSFIAGQSVTGTVSSTTRVITSFDELKNENDSIDDTVKVEMEADLILDFDEKSPFGDES